MYLFQSFMVIFETTCAELLIECHGCSPGSMQECRDNILIKLLFLALTRLQREMWVTTCCCFTCFYGLHPHHQTPSNPSLCMSTMTVHKTRSIAFCLALLWLTQSVGQCDSEDIWALSHLSDGLRGKGWSKINMEATAGKENLPGTLVSACCVPWLCVQPWCGSWGRPWTGTVFGTVGTSGHPGAEWVYDQRKDQVTGIKQPNPLFWLYLLLNQLCQCFLCTTIKCAIWGQCLGQSKNNSQFNTVFSHFGI